MLLEGSVLENRYQILRPIGKGGNSIVYEAVQLRTGRRLAVKEMTASAQGEASREMLKLQRQLRHPGLPMILDVLEGEEGPLIVMEYMEGTALKQEIARRETEKRNFSLQEVLKIGRDLCRILEYLHTRPVPLLYLDLKPANILLKPSGEAQLVDLGSLCPIGTRESDHAGFTGTLGYAAPEQYRRDAGAGPETDLYSLGVILHQILTGIDPVQNPFSFQKITEAAPERFALYKGEERKVILGLEKIVKRCTSFRKEERYSDAGELLRDLLDPAGCLKRQRRTETITAGLMLLLLFVSLSAFLLCRFSEQRIHILRNEGKEYCLRKASAGEPEQFEEWIRTALFFSPGDSDCFNMLLEHMLVDGTFSREEYKGIQKLLELPSEETGETQEVLLREDSKVWFSFSYSMGRVCLYAVSGIPDYTLAAFWFAEVQEAGEVWNPGDSADRKEKIRILHNTEMLIGICRYRQQVLKGGWSAAEGTSLTLYWQELTGLLKEETDENQLPVTELGLWRELLGLLNDWPSELQRAGISLEMQKRIIGKIREQAASLRESNQLAGYPELEEQLVSIEKTLEITEEKHQLLREAL